MKNTPKKATEKGKEPTPVASRGEHHHHHHDDKELYIIEADGNVKKVDLPPEEAC